MSIYIESAVHRNSAAAAAVWGTRFSASPSCYPPGKQVHSRAILSALSVAVAKAPPDLPLIIYTSSAEMIRVICYDVPLRKMHDWSMPDDDLLQCLVSVLCQRTAPVSFRETRKYTKPSLAYDAREMAKEAVNEHNASHGNFLGESECVMPDVPTSPPPMSCRYLSSVHDCHFVCRVSSSVYPEDLPVSNPCVLPPPEDVDTDSESHHARSRVRSLMWNNLRQLVEVVSNHQLWSLVHKWADRRARPCPVSLSQFQNTFHARMNPPPCLPYCFDIP